jgi:hypothetical protein
VILYVVQCSYGGVIHFVKSSKPTGRPPQNYGHAVLGLLIIGLSFWQVNTGLDDEWQAIGGSYIPTSIWTWWKVWVVVSCWRCYCGCNKTNYAPLDDSDSIPSRTRPAPAPISKGGRATERWPLTHYNFEPKVATSQAWCLTIE